MATNQHLEYRLWQDTSDAFNSDCPVRAVLDHITGRWGVLTLTALTRGPLRFSELSRIIEGISEKMLSQTLRMLIRDGLILRSVEPATPPRVSYELTELGRELTESLRPLLDWLYRRTSDVVAAQVEHDRVGR
jgi:DNA-binding HxlR family transcriptional regulator